MPCCKHAIVDTHASKTHAKPFWAMQCHFAPVSTSVRKRGKTPQFRFFIETRKSVLYIQIITQSNSCQQYQFRQSHQQSETRLPASQRNCESIQARSCHTIPATPHDPARSPIRHDTTPHAHGSQTWQDIAQHSAQAWHAWRKGISFI